jgi:hypothetical protein
VEKNLDKYIKHGIFAALFISLLVFTIQENRVREREYRNIIQQQTEANGKFADMVKIDLSDIKSRLRERG